MASILRNWQVLVCTTCVVCGTVTGRAESSRLATYDGQHETAFALSVSADLPALSTSRTDIVILFDTSASQTGAIRDRGMAALQALLEGLSDADRVQLLAVDVEAVAMTDQWLSPHGEKVAAATQRLLRRAPLGATDLSIALERARAMLGSSQQRKHVIYLGDGLSRLQLFDTDILTDLVDSYTKAHIPCSSYAIGPQRDVGLLAALANQTGGNLVVDSESAMAAEAGGLLAETVAGTVFWPTAANWSEGFEEIFPSSFPPLRADRDSIVIGTLQRDRPLQLRLDGTMAGGAHQLTWSFQLEPSNEDFSTLPTLVTMARSDNGISLPTVGSEGMRESLRLLTKQAEDLATMAREALGRNELDDARKLSEAALQLDEGNPTATAVQRRVAHPAKEDSTKNEKTRFIQLIVPEDGVVQDGVVPNDAPITLDEGATGPFDGVIIEPPSTRGSGGLIVNPSSAAEFAAEDGQFVDRVLAKRRAQEGLLRTMVRNAIADARDAVRDDPSLAMQDLKLLLENVRNTPDVSDDLRSQLRNQVESAIRATARRQFERQQRDAEAARSLAQAEERQRIVAAMQREEEQIKQIIDTFNHLMDEGRYDLAIDTAEVLEEIVPFTEVSEGARTKSLLAYNVTEAIRIYRLTNQALVATLASVERSHIPFPDDPPLVYPSAEFWEDITRRRDKYKEIEFAEPGSAEDRILKALDSQAEIDFSETPLEEALSVLEEDHDIQIDLDRFALDSAAIDPTSPVTKSLKGISLRSALRLMLREFELTYVVRDEVLQITTVEEAEANPITKVYPVGDLVVPIISGLGGGVGGIGGGGLGMQLNGGGLGGGGGGFGGGGLGGGGFGGGGLGGGGGGGGFFDVDDPISLADRPQAPDDSQGPRPAARRPQRIRPTTSPIEDDAWHDFFKQQSLLAEDQRISEADIRETVRQLMVEKKYRQTVALIDAALTHGLPQAWMYQAMALALQADGAETKDIERALLSAVDLGATIEEVYYAASYLARMGLDQRALQLLKTVTAADPSNPEPYALALRIARRSGDPDGMKWACLGVLGQAWPSEQAQIEKEAHLLARATLARLQREGKSEEVERFRAGLNQAAIRDCIATVSWSGEADVDLLVKEPAGTVCSLRDRRTRSGGLLLADVSAESHPKTSAEGLTEAYVCPSAFAGKYQLLVRPIWGKVANGQVTVQVAIHAGTSEHQVLTQQIELADEPVMVEFELDHGRRVEPIEVQQIATIAEKREAISRAILAQHLTDPAESLATSQLLQDQNQNAQNLIRAGLIGPRLRTGVGFRPVITTLPDGANMTVTAVVSADRRYVRITPQPTFSGVTEVATFNFVTGEETTNGGTGGNGGN